MMSGDARSDFEASPLGDGLVGWPEVGSRAITRLALAQNCDGWVVVQPSRYRYLACAGPDAAVRMVISEYLACEVVWE